MDVCSTSRDVKFCCDVCLCSRKLETFVSTADGMYSVHSEL